MPVAIDPMDPTDWPRVAAVYAAGIDTGQATFETDVPSAVAGNVGDVQSEAEAPLARTQDVGALGRAARTRTPRAVSLDVLNAANVSGRGTRWEVWDDRHLDASRLVARDGAEVVGWAALAPVSHREVYHGVAEVSLYVDPQRSGEGIGSALMSALVLASESAGIWSLRASIFPENPASIALHLRHGFREVGIRERVARHHGVWRDTVLLERRSAAVGVD